MRSKLTAVFIIILALLMQAACGGGTGKDEQTSSQDTSGQTETEKPAETESRAPDPSPEETEEWVASLVSDAVQKLSDEGIIAVSFEDYDMMIPFVEGDKGEMVPDFSDEAKGRELTEEFSLSGGRMIISENGEVLCTSKRLRRTDPVPYFFPSGSTGILIYDTNNTEAFADSLDDCRYLVYYRGFESKTDKAYYNNTYDRIHVTTVVFIIDTETRKVVHMETVGTDAPGNITDDRKGKVLYDRAEGYIRGLADK
ncbi:MAG: hypothetical protein IJM62_08425 [Lachnospiraceae bacterium]|nr:hypothetical protein [Lachnospiraceae bacterium]